MVTLCRAGCSAFSHPMNQFTPIPRSKESSNILETPCIWRCRPVPSSRRGFEGASQLRVDKFEDSTGSTLKFCFALIKVLGIQDT